jgi:predicted small metal-binding protein
MLMKLLHCPCGVLIKGRSDEEILANARAHLASEHPELRDEYTDEQILSMTTGS